MFATTTALLVAIATATGWCPIAVYDGGLLSVVVPFETIGILGAADLVDVLWLSSDPRALLASDGLAVCVGRGLLLFGGLVGSGVAAAVAPHSYDLATVVFLSTVAGLLVALRERSTSAIASRSQGLGIGPAYCDQ